MMKVANLIKKLQSMPADAEVYFGRFDGFLFDGLKPVRPKNVKEITDKEAHDLFPVDCEFKTVYCWTIKQQKYIAYSGVIFEIDS